MCYVSITEFRKKFDYYLEKSMTEDVPTLRRWANQLTFGHYYEGESNITLRIIKQAEL